MDEPERFAELLRDFMADSVFPRAQFRLSRCATRHAALHQPRETSAAVAIAVARAAAHDKVARETVDDTIEERVRATMWQPVYSDVHAILS